MLSRTANDAGVSPWVNETGVKIVRAIRFNKELSLFRTKGKYPNSVRKNFVALIIVFAQTVFFVYPLPRALPWAIIFWPYEAGKTLSVRVFVNYFSMKFRWHLKGRKHENFGVLGWIIA